MMLVIWYAVLCLVAMPLDGKLSRWHKRFAPPILTAVWFVGGALVIPEIQSAEDLEQARQMFKWWRSLDHVWVWVVGLVVAFPVLWQAAGAAQEWKEMKQRHREPQGEPGYAEFELPDGSTVLIEKCKP